MNRLSLCTAMAVVSLLGSNGVLAGPSGEDYIPHNRYEEDTYERPDTYQPEERYEYRERREVIRHYPAQPRTVYVIINGCPVRRVVYANPGGGHYCIQGGRRVILRQPYYTSYPSRHFHPSGRPRIMMKSRY